MTLAKHIQEKLNQAKMHRAKAWGERSPKIKAKIGRRLERAAERAGCPVVIPAKLFGEYTLEVRRWLTGEGFLVSFSHATGDLHVSLRK